MAIIDTYWWVWLLGGIVTGGATYYCLRFAMSDGLGRILLFANNLASTCFFILFIVAAIIKLIRYATHS